MNRTVYSPQTLTIDRNQTITQGTLNEVKAFQKSLGANARVLFKRSGNTVTYTEHRESVLEKFFRKLDKFEKNVQAAWSRVNDLFTDKNQGNNPEATKDIKGTPTHKSLPPESGSMSVKKFNLEIAPLSNTCIIPVLDDLAHQRGELKDLGRMICEMNVTYALKFFSTDPQILEQVEKEFSAFVQFAQAQGHGQSVAHQNRDAINFANRWVAIPLSEHGKLKVGFGKSYDTISSAASHLAAFAETSPFDKS